MLFEGTKVSGSEDTGLAGASCIMRKPIISSTQECSRGHQTNCFLKKSFIEVFLCFSRNRMWGHGILYKKEGGVQFSGLMRNDKIHRNEDEETGH